MNHALLSSKSITWGTPTELFEKLDAEYHFVLDTEATKETAKCRLYYYRECLMREPIGKCAALEGFGGEG